MMRLPKAFWKNFELIVLSRLPYYVFLGLLTLKGKVCSYEAKEKAQRGILGLCACIYGSRHTEYNVHFVCSAVVEGILVIQSVQRDASTQTAIFHGGIFGLRDTATEVSVREMKIRCRTTSGGRTFRTSTINTIYSIKTF